MPAKEARSRKRVEHLIHEAERSNAATAEIEELLSGGSGFIRVSIATAIICLAEQHTRLPRMPPLTPLLLLCRSTRTRIPSPTSHLTGPSGGLALHLCPVRASPGRTSPGVTRRPCDAGRRRAAAGRTGPPARPPGGPAPPHGLRANRPPRTASGWAAPPPPMSRCSPPGPFAAADLQLLNNPPRASNPPRARPAALRVHPARRVRPAGPADLRRHSRRVEGG